MTRADISAEILVDQRKAAVAAKNACVLRDEGYLSEAILCQRASACASRRARAAMGVEEESRQTLDQAIELLNERLGLDLRVTLRGDEVKGAFPDGDGGTSKGYLGAGDCAVCARAFETLAEALRGGR